LIRHGSENSLDVDVVYLFPYPQNWNQLTSLLPDRHLCLRFCNYHKAQNRNIMVLDEKTHVVRECLKGLIDELNNSLLFTFGLHEQSALFQSVNPIERSVERVVILKVVRAVRSVLSRVSRSHLRSVVKLALQSHSLSEYVRVVAMIDFDHSSVQSCMDIEGCKSVAFQLAQTYCLMTDHVEVWTKNQVAQTCPDLELFMKRDPECMTLLNRLTTWKNKIVEEMQGITVYSLDGLTVHDKLNKTKQKKSTLNLMLSNKKLSDSPNWNAVTKQCIGIVIDMFPGLERCVYFGLDVDTLQTLLELGKHIELGENLTIVQPFLHHSELVVSVIVYDVQLDRLLFDEDKSRTCHKLFEAESMQVLMQTYPDYHIVYELKGDTVQPVSFRHKFTNQCFIGDISASS